MYHVSEFNKVLKGEESETGKQIFSILSGDTKGESLGLRFDLTVPFARVLAANPYNAKDKTGIKLPFKRMALGSVFRGERPQKGRYRQFSQFDIDIAGSDLMLADAEIVNIMWQTMKNLGIEQFVIRVNNRKILQSFSEVIEKLLNSNQNNSNKNRDYSISIEKINTEIIRTIDKVDKLGIEKIILELEDSLNEYFKLPNKIVDEIINRTKGLLTISGDNFSQLKQCEKLFKDSKTAQEGISELREVFELLQNGNNAKQNISVDFSIARGLDYYTGTIMETSLLNAPDYGSVFSGGRYNKLMEKFTGRDLPVVGASIGVDRLFAALNELGLLSQNKKTSTEVMVLRLSGSEDTEYLKIAQKIREVKRNVSICLLSDTTFKSQFNFALNSGVKYIVIAGEDERKRGIVQIKNLESQEQVEVTLSDVGDYFAEIV